MDEGAWQATAHRGAKSRTQLSDFPFLSLYSSQGKMESMTGDPISESQIVLVT